MSTAEWLSANGNNELVKLFYDSQAFGDIIYSIL